MGEFGAWRANPVMFPNQTAAATAMTEQQVASCLYGFKGWLYWTADSWEQPRLWNFVSAPKIEHELSPNVRPDPCGQ